MIPEQLITYLQARLPGATSLRIDRLERVGGGASRETWVVVAAWSEGGTDVQRALVIRRDPAAGLLESDRRLEFEVMRAARAMGVPVPEQHWLELDPQWLDRPFAVMECMEGVAPPVVFPAAESAATRAVVAAEFMTHLATIHRGDWRALGLEFLGVPAPGRDAAARQVAWWRREYERQKPDEHPILALALHWLDTHLPAAGEITLVHGDYRVGNILYQGGHITAVLDWEMAHLGDPLEDLAWAVLDFWYGSGLCQGLMPKEEMIAAYERARGVRVDRDVLFFYEVLGHVKMAVISLTGVKSFSEGRVADVVMALVGLMVPRLERHLLRQLAIPEPTSQSRQ